MNKNKCPSVQLSGFYGVGAEEILAACFNLGLTLKVRASLVSTIVKGTIGSPNPPQVPSPQGIFDPNAFITTNPAVTLRPTTTFKPRTKFADLENKQPLWNLLIDSIARHPTFLSQTLQDTAASDGSFTGKWYQMYHEVYGIERREMQTNLPPSTPLSLTIESRNTNNSSLYGSNISYNSTNGETRNDSGKVTFSYNKYRTQQAMLGIFRNDFMEEDQNSTLNNQSSPLVEREDFLKPKNDSNSSCHGSKTWKQVEINTISVSFVGLSPLVADLHRLVSRNVSLQIKPGYDFFNSTIENDKDIKNSIKRGQKEVINTLPPPQNIHKSQSLTIVAAAIARAAYYYIENEIVKTDTESTKNFVTNYTPVICFVIQENERNTADQYAIAFEIEKTYKIRCIRRTLCELYSSLRLIDYNLIEGDKEVDVVGKGDKKGERSEDDKTNEISSSSIRSCRKPPRAVIDSIFEPAVFYFRCGYTPNDFALEGQWETRKNIEICNSIKCPSLPFYLCTFKKVQQVLTGFMHNPSSYFNFCENGEKKTKGKWRRTW